MNVMETSSSVPFHEERNIGIHAHVHTHTHI